MSTTLQEIAEAAASPANNSGRVYVQSGAFLAFVDGRWFKCSEEEVNLPLSRKVSKIGVALEAFSYAEDEGSPPHVTKTFTLRQYWQNPGLPSLDFDDQKVIQMRDNIRIYQGQEASLRWERVLFPALAAFRTLYRDYQADLAKRGHAPLF